MDLILLITRACLLISFNCYLTLCGKTKRTLAYTSGSSFGYLAAVAVPLDLPQTNVYVAFNLETNYGLPPNTADNSLLKKWNSSDFLSDVSNNVTNIERNRKQRSLFTRVNFYRSIIGHLENFGPKGTDCLLRFICEVAASKMQAFNGVLGNILHVLLLPSSSREEIIPLSAYHAEELGNKNNCHRYKNACPQGLLNKISLFL